MEVIEIEIETEESLEEMCQAQDDMLQTLALKLEGKFNEVATLRKDIETRWLDDYRAYCGQYSAEEEARFDDKNFTGSRAFANLTRPKTVAMEAKLSDTLFPTDESNFGLRTSKFSSDPDLAEAATKKMYSTLRQQLAEARDAAVSREVIHYGMVFGTGIKKGPILSNRVKKAWMDDSGVPVLQVVDRKVPDFQSVPPWNFFPDMSATKLANCEFVFERQYLSQRELQDIAKLPGIIPSQMHKVLQTAPDATTGDEFANDMRQEVSDIQPKVGTKKYVMKMYHGPISQEDLRVSGEYTAQEVAGFEPVVMGEVWYIGPYAIKVNINPLDSGDFPYSVWSPIEDDTCVFGYGLPYLLRHPQAARNSSWRMILDNAGMSVGPQIVIDQKTIYPADGQWTLNHNKIWKKKQSDIPVDHAFKVYNITNNQQDLMSIFKMSRELADEETNMPLVSQSNESATMMASKTGVMSMVMNAQNVTHRLAVKNWDDSVTIPDITRLYHWNMQFNPDPEIKCDCEPYAKGSSELMIKEIQAQNAGNLVQISANIPQFAERTDWPSLHEQIVRAFQFSPEDVILSEAKIQEIAANKQEQPSVEMLDIQLKQEEIKVSREKLELQKYIHEGKMEQQEKNREMRMILAEVDKEKLVVTLAAQKNISTEQAQAKLAGKQLDGAVKEKIQLNETKVKLATGSGL
jgi:hypothetical protein